MIWIIIGIIVGAIVGKNRDSWYGVVDDIVTGIIFGAFIGVIVTVVMTALNAMFNWCPLETATVTDAHEIVQISDRTYTNTSGRISGSIFLIRGNVGTDLSAGFSFYQKEANGFSLKTIEASNTTIKYTNEQPRIETTRTYCPERENSFLSIGWLWSNYCPAKDGNTWNTIYVPEGSIVEEYKLGGEE